MNRLTRNIKKKQNYCEFELKECRYQDIYGFKNYSELEEYVDCDLTLAIDKLGQYEGLDENNKISYDLLIKIIKQEYIYHKDKRRNNEILPFKITKYCYEGKSLKLRFKVYNIEIKTSYTLTGDTYGKTWALTKEELL